MDQPVIRVRKGAVVYDDAPAASEERRPLIVESRPPAPRRRRPGGRAAFFPLIVVAAGLLLFFRLASSRESSRADLAGWQITLRVAATRQELLVGLTFVSKAPRPPASEAAEREATARVTLLGTGEEVFLAGVLAKSPMTLRGELPNVPVSAPGAAPTGPAVRKVRAEVTIEGARTTLIAVVPTRLIDLSQPPGG